MTEEIVSKFLRDRSHVWRLDNGKEIYPTQDDVSKALDKAREVLYTGKPGDLLIVAGLLIHKTETGYDVYVLAGSIE